MNTSRFALLALTLALPTLRADPPGPASIKFSNPANPQLVRIYVAQGSVKVRAGDSKDMVTVTTDAAPEKPETPRPDGLRVISGGSSFTLTESDNVVELNYGRDSFPTTPGADFSVTVPKQASIEISNGWNTDMSVEGVTGDVEIKNMNGAVKLNDLGGGALVETMNGEIKATFSAVNAGKPLSFTSMNGEIEVHVPADTKANLRFRSQNGSILTDFPEDVLKTKTESISTHATPTEAARIAGDAAREAARVAREVVREVHEAMRDAGVQPHGTSSPRAPAAPRPPSIPAMVGGKVVTGTLNGGGTDIQIATMNGDIIVRRVTAKQ